MFCYRCKGTLDLHRNICPACGADVTMYKKIVYASNKHYNEALLKARARDLSGARDELYASLHFNKKNVPARNLLGLVLYAMGESAEAVKEWVISANLMPNSNIANRYIKEMRRSSKDLNSENHGIIKFNQALQYAQNGSLDLAVIQLKKVISVHPNMVKAYELLALLYMDAEKYDQARKVLNLCLQVDRGNVNALNYLREIEGLTDSESTKSAGVAGEDGRESLIIPIRMRDYGTYLSNAIYILLGVLVGALIAFFVIVPGKVNEKTNDALASLSAYESQIADLQKQIALHDSTSETTTEATTSAPTETTADVPASSEVVEKEERLTEYPDRIATWTRNQKAVGECVAEWNGGDVFNLGQTFFSINPALLTEQNAEHYTNLAKLLLSDAGKNLLQPAAEAYVTAGDFLHAAKCYDSLILAFPDEVTYRYQAGLQYESAADTEKAANRFYQVIQLFPESTEAADAKERYLALTGETEVPALPENINIEREKTPYSAEELIAEIVVQ